MPKFNVYLLTSALSWEGVEASSAEDAISKCGTEWEVGVFEQNADLTRMVAYEVDVEEDGLEEDDDQKGE